MKDTLGELDNIDLKLLDELRRDADQTSEQLSQQLGISASAIRRRIYNLKKSGLMRIRATVHPSLLEGLEDAFIALNVRPGKSQAVAAELMKFEAIRSLSTTLGRFDILVLVRFKSKQELTEFVSNVLPKIKGIVRQETLSIATIYKLHGDTFD